MKTVKNMPVAEWVDAQEVRGGVHNGLQLVGQCHGAAECTCVVKIHARHIDEQER